MKPWEETWIENAGDVWNGSDHILSTRAPDCTAEHAEARGKLAAAAPEMARLLLDLRSGHGSYIDHADIVRIDEVLRKAGIAC